MVDRPTHKIVAEGTEPVALVPKAEFFAKK